MTFISYLVTLFFLSYVISTNLIIMTLSLRLAVAVLAVTRSGLEFDWLWRSPFKVKNGSIWSDHTEIGLHSMATKMVQLHFVENVYVPFWFRHFPEPWAVLPPRSEASALTNDSNVSLLLFFLATLVFWWQWRLQEKSSFLKRAVNYIAWLFRRRHKSENWPQKSHALEDGLSLIHSILSWKQLKINHATPIRNACSVSLIKLQYFSGMMVETN